MSRTFAIDAAPAGPSGADSLLGPADPAPIEVRHAQASAPVLLLCEHAGQAVPEALNGLGLPLGAIDQHIGWDIGAEALACAIAERLRCPLVLQRYSRLVIDCNRPPGSEGSMPVVSDGIPVPGNTGLSAQARVTRETAIFDPMNTALDTLFDRHPRKAAFSIHSFTRHFQGGDRPWDAGFLARRDSRTAHALMQSLGAEAPELNLALNQPYQIDDGSDWFIPRHAEARGLQHTLIEVRNDHLSDETGVNWWADRLTTAIRSVLENGS